MKASDKGLSVPEFVDVLPGTTSVEFTAAAASKISSQTVVAVVASTIGKSQILRITIEP
jgi:hypothetical protein